jgi:hypothetical protein
MNAATTADSGETLGAILDAALERAESPSPRRIAVMPPADPNEAVKVIAERVRIDFSPPGYVQLFLTEDRSRGGAVVFHRVTGTDAEIMAFSETPGIWARSVLRVVAHTAFYDLDLNRITLRIRSSDRAARDYARRLGFRHEGTQRRAFGDEDAQLWGMLRGECPWFRG